MDFELSTISSYSILVPSVLACVYFTRLTSNYKPFLFFIIAGFCAEFLCQIYIQLHRSFTIVTNVYLLIQAVYITWQFKNWGLFKKYRYIYLLLQIIYVLLWLEQDISLNSTEINFSDFIIIGDFILAIMSITIINKLVVKVHGSLWKDPVFLICLGWLVLFIFSIISETFFKYSLGDPDYAYRMYNIFQVVNIFANIIFGIAILWIPSKAKFILPSSSPA